jgi:hypothetical protein
VNVHAYKYMVTTMRKQANYMPTTYETRSPSTALCRFVWNLTTVVVPW